MSQNWALLNPAYKYNYSNDGSDTISNQIFVTDIDTLGTDSFRYELNTIAELADTATAYDLFLRTNVPQFLQKQVTVSGGTWWFQDPGSFVMQPGAAPGGSWVFDTLTNVIATVMSIDTADQFGSSIARKTIALSNGGNITISEEFGVLSWGEEQLIGAHGPDVGILIPSLHEFYGLQPGDIACYDRNYWRVWGGNTIMSESYGQFKKRTVLSRVESEDHVELGYTGVSCTSWAIDAVENIYDDWGHECLGPGSGSWTLPGIEFGFGDDDPFEVFPFHDLIGSYPGQVILDTSFLELWALPMMIVAEHGLDEDGRYVIRARKFRDADGALHGWFAIPSNEVQPGLFELSPDDWIEDNGVLYRERIGLIRYRIDGFESGESLELTGSVIDDDTTGTVTSDSVLLGISDEQSSTTFKVYPNPASDRLNVTMPQHLIARWRISFLDGRLIAKGLFQGSTEQEIDVAAFASGSYLLTIDTERGHTSQRLIIAR